MTKDGKYIINVRSKADLVQGHGVLSAGREQMQLVREGLAERFELREDHKYAGDITHYHTINVSHFVGLPFAKASGKTVAYVHFLPETVAESLRLPKLAFAVFARYLIAFYKSMDALVVVNPVFIDRLATCGVPRERITYIPNFVDDRGFYPVSNAQKRRLREDYGLAPDRFTVVCSGQLQTRKGVTEFARLAQRLPEVQFLWAGGFSFGKMTDGYEEIKSLLRNCPDNLYFPGMVPREGMNAFYNLGDVLFLPSYSELFPMTVLEAMSCHLPILLRELDVYPKILYDFYNSGRDTEEFESVLRELRQNPAAYAAAKAASARGHAFYGKANVLALWDAFYSELAAVPERGTLRPGKRVAT